MTLNWHESEWADVGQSAYLRGYVADVWQTDGTRLADRGTRGAFAWVVKATEDVSEWPEVQAINTTRHRTLDAAKRAAEKALRRVAENAPAYNPNTGQLNAWAKEET